MKSVVHSERGLFVAWLNGAGHHNRARRFYFHKHVFKLWLWPLSNPRQVSCDVNHTDLSWHVGTQRTASCSFHHNSLRILVLVQHPSSAEGYLKTVRSWPVWWPFMVNGKEYGRYRISPWFLILLSTPCQLPRLYSVCLLSTASNSRIIMNDVREITWKEVA